MAQLVERLLCKQEARGPSPRSSTRRDQAQGSDVGGRTLGHRGELVIGRGPPGQGSGGTRNPERPCEQLLTGAATGIASGARDEQFSRPVSR